MAKVTLLEMQEPAMLAIASSIINQLSLGNLYDEEIFWATFPCIGLDRDEVVILTIPLTTTTL